VFCFASAHIRTHRQTAKNSTGRLSACLLIASRTVVVFVCRLITTTYLPLPTARMKRITAKVLCLGAQGVGKTSIVLRQIGEGFSDRVKSTIGASFNQSTIQVGTDTAVVLQIWDTAGQERFRSLVTMYYRNAAAAFLVYDITDNNSFYQLRSWVDELERFVGQPIILCVVGNKTDLIERREVDGKQAKQFAESIGAMYFETSAQNNKGIADAFTELAERIVENERRRLAESKQKLAGNGIALDANDNPTQRKKKCCGPS